MLNIFAFCYYFLFRTLIPITTAINFAEKENSCERFNVSNEIEMQRMNKESLKQWKKKRSSTFMVYCIMYLLSGMQTAFMNATIWIYVTRQIRTKKPYLVFGILNAIIFLPSVLSNPVIAYCGDKYRRPKLMLYCTNMLSIIGSILYLFYFSAWFPIIGSFILGFRYSLRSIMVAEIARSYPQNEVAKKLPLFSNFYYVGLCPTVVILIFFEKVDINIGGLHIQYGNINAIFIIFMTVIIQTLAVFYVHDLSKEYDLKEEETNQKKQYQIKEKDMVEIESNGREKLIIEEKEFSQGGKLKRLLTNFDVGLSYFLTFFYAYAEMAILKYVPIVIITKLHYKVTLLNIGLLANSIMSIIILWFLVRVYITAKSAFYVCVIAFFSMIVLGLLFLLMKPGNSCTVNWILAMFLYTLFSVFYLADDVFLVCLTAKLVKSDIQSLAESVRLSIKHMSSILAGLSIQVVTDHYDVFYISISVVIIISLSLLFFRRKSLTNPQPLV